MHMHISAYIAIATIIYNHYILQPHKLSHIGSVHASKLKYGEVQNGFYTYLYTSALVFFGFFGTPQAICFQ